MMEMIPPRPRRGAGAGGEAAGASLLGVRKDVSDRIMPRDRPNLGRNGRFQVDTLEHQVETS
jgi:hypothetical protein